MTVKDIINLLPKEHPLRLEINNMWEELVLKDDCAYNRVIQEYGDYIVIGIEAWDNGIYDYATLWLKVEEPAEDYIKERLNKLILNNDSKESN